MDRPRILELLDELHAVLSQPRHGEMTLPPGFSGVVITPESIEANEQDPMLLKSLELTSQILDLSASSRGMKEYLLDVVDTWTRLGMPAHQILGFFGVRDGDWDLFDPSKVQAAEYHWLDADIKSLFENLLGSLLVILPEELVSEATTVGLSALFEHMMESLRETTGDLVNVPDLWVVRFEQARRILSWMDQYQERYGESPAGFEEVRPRIEKFLRCSP